MSFHEYAGGCLGTHSPRVVAALGRKLWHLEMAGNEASLQGSVADTEQVALAGALVPWATPSSDPLLSGYSQSHFYLQLSWGHQRPLHHPLLR